ncbi:MAG: hypothetical protein SNF68_01805 [Rikenellaceae bacterium]
MKRLTTIIATTLISVACNSHLPEGTILCQESKSEAITSSEICKLGENIEYLTNIINFKIISDTTFIAMTAKQAYLYNMDGKQLCRVGRQGRARGEYLTPYSAETYNGQIFLGCINSRKIIEYTMQGEFVREYKLGNRCRVNNFSVCDKYIQLYGDMSSEDNERYYLQSYDKESGKIVATMAQYSDVDIIFSNVMFADGYVGATDDEILIVSLSDLTLNRYTHDGEEQLLDIDSPTFKVDCSVDYDKISASSFELIGDYIESNSIVTMASYDGDMLYIITTDRFSGSSFENIEFERNLLIVDTKRGRGEYRAMEQVVSVFDRGYQLYNGDIYSLTTIAGEHYIRKINL